MAKKKQVGKSSKNIIPFWQTSWNDIDKTIDNFRKEMERTFSSFSVPSIPKMQGMQQFPQTTCDLIDEGNQFRAKMAVPGVRKNEINLNVSDNSIEVSAEHKESSEEKKKSYLRKELSNVSFYRTLPLPEPVKSNQAKAKLNDGILEITLPKEKPTPKPKKKSVKVQ